MRIATWNVERAPLGKRPAILGALAAVNADIVILTETHRAIMPEGYASFSSLPLPAKIEFEGAVYKPGENRVTLLSRYPVVGAIPTSNPNTTACIEVNTPHGSLLVYGAIIGTLGIGKGFDRDLETQLYDVQKLTQGGKNICYAGDFNTTICDNTCGSNKARETLGNFFSQYGLNILTGQMPLNVDHIVISRSFPRDARYKTGTWNEDEKLSDHMGVWVDVEF